MPTPLRLVVVNAAYDHALTAPDQLLDRYDTLTGWADAIAATGAAVHVVQRFARQARLTRGRVAYTFVCDGQPPVLPPRSTSPAVVDHVRTHAPEVLHVNGLLFPALVGSLRRALGDAPAIVVQDHAGCAPPGGAGPLAAWRRRGWIGGLGSADAVSFTSIEQAAPWREAGVLRDQAVLEIVESSTGVRPTPRAEARRRVGLHGAPLVLWVGRLIPGKDPRTVLAGFEAFARDRPAARLAMVFPDGGHEAHLRAEVDASPRLRASVTFVGAVPHEAIGDYYGAADLYVSASRAEGSGYALIEAMACGVVPVIDRKSVV